MFFKIENWRKHLPDVGSLQRRNTSWEDQRNMGAIRLSVLISTYRRRGPSHADLNMVVPMSGFRAPVHFEQNLVRFDNDAGNLNLVAQPCSRPTLSQGVIPRILVVSSIAAEYERLLGSRQQDLRSSKLGCQASFDFHALVKAQLVRTQALGQA